MEKHKLSFTLYFIFSLSWGWRYWRKIEMSRVKYTWTRQLKISYGIIIGSEEDLVKLPGMKIYKITDIFTRFLFHLYFECLSYSHNISCAPVCATCNDDGWRAGSASHTSTRSTSSSHHILPLPWVVSFCLFLLTPWLLTHVLRCVGTHSWTARIFVFSTMNEWTE